MKQVQELRTKCADVEANSVQTIAKIKEKHANEMKRAKEQWAAAESTR